MNGGVQRDRAVPRLRSRGASPLPGPRRREETGPHPRHPGVCLSALWEVVGVTRQCDVCGDELPPSDLIEVGDGRACPECHNALFVDESTDTAGTESTDDSALNAFADAVAFFQDQLDRPIADHQSGEHTHRPDTTQFKHRDRDRLVDILEECVVTGGDAMSAAAVGQTDVNGCWTSGPDSWRTTAPR